MEELIRQMFLHEEVIGPQVAEGRYNLVGPNGETILPQVWETTIEPDWVITMHMGMHDATKPPAATSALPDERKKPIRFTDAVGRKYIFPFHFCKTWAVSDNPNPQY